MFLSTGTLQSYSEQQLVDCSKQNNGCNGGLMDYAFQYIETSPLMQEGDYQYTARDGSCKYVQSKSARPSGADPSLHRQAPWRTCASLAAPT